MQVLLPGFEVSLEEHKPPMDVLNAQPIWVPKQPGLTADAWELYPIQGQSFVQNEVFVSALDSLVEQLHLGLSVNSQSILKAPLIAPAT